MRFSDVFNYLDVDEIDLEGVDHMARKLGVCIGCGPGDFYVKANWKIYREYTVFGSEVDGRLVRLFHIKRLWERSPVLEVLGLHLAHLLDPDLGPDNYLFGRYNAGRWVWKKPAFYILTTWVEGKPLSKKILKDPSTLTGEDREAILHALGRHSVMHEFLSLYDVEVRHFLYTPWKTLHRIDFGLSFLHLDYPEYNGFTSYFGKSGIVDQPVFQEGVEYERGKLARSLVNNEKKLKDALRLVLSLDQSHPDVFLKTDIFGAFLRDYWERTVDFAPAGEWASEVFESISVAETSN
ncbi:MAG: hypothetical protein ACTSU5_04425 [Promethearchaeota archaeon]